MGRTPWLAGSSASSIQSLMLAYRQGDWVDSALCAQIGSHDTFFPEKGVSSAEAKRICGMCEVAADCLEYALGAPYAMHGVWGGTTENQRREMRRSSGMRAQREDRLEHGTPGGARAHYRRGERPCGSCSEAARLAKRMRR